MEEKETTHESPEEESSELNTEGETPQLEHAEERPSIESISALSDEELHDLLGHKKDIEDVRKGLAQTAKLKGKAREYAEERIADMFRPNVYSGSFKYLAEDALRATKKSDAKQAFLDDSPSSVLD